MARCRKPTDQDLMRLDAIAKHLKVRARYPDSSFNADVTAACLTRIAPIIDNLFPCTGEQIGLALGKHLCVTFEEVHDADDVEQILGVALIHDREIPVQSGGLGIDAEQAVGGAGQCRLKPLCLRRNPKPAAAQPRPKDRRFWRRTKA